jgi:hypothetical protein
MSDTSRGLELLSAVLLGNAIEAADLHRLVRERVEESLYLEYKRGKWLGDGTRSDLERKQLLRAYVSGFANAEGGLLAIGIVGGEDCQRGEAWSLEGPTCPSGDGWSAWLEAVLQDISVKARVRHQVVDCGVSGEVVLIAVDRAESLIRVYEKPRLVCHLRVGQSTLPIDETLYVDLVLGRRAKPVLELEGLPAHAINDSESFRLGIKAVVNNLGLVWVDEYKSASIGYAQGGVGVPGHVLRHLDVAKPVPDEGNFRVSLFDLHPPDKRLRPFESLALGNQVKGFPRVPAGTSWFWAGAVLFVPANGGPLWAQVAAHGEGPHATRVGGATSRVGQAPWIAWAAGAAEVIEVSKEFERRMQGMFTWATPNAH